MERSVHGGRGRRRIADFSPVAATERPGRTNNIHRHPTGVRKLEGASSDLISSEEKDACRGIPCKILKPIRRITLTASIPSLARPSSVSAFVRRSFASTSTQLERLKAEVSGARRVGLGKSGWQGCGVCGVRAAAARTHPHHYQAQKSKALNPLQKFGDHI